MELVIIISLNKIHVYISKGQGRVFFWKLKFTRTNIKDKGEANFAKLAGLGEDIMVWLPSFYQQ